MAPTLPEDCVSSLRTDRADALAARAARGRLRATIVIFGFYSVLGVPDRCRRGGVRLAM